MCGIAGAAGIRDSREARDAVCAMVGALSRRGPDGEGVAAWDDVTLGHRRLAIFDLSDAGKQPMVTEDRRLGVVFNGAIYNFHALRAELERGGVAFHSRTDTEVLLHGYRAWGIDGLVGRLRGMFAFGLWDAERRRLFLVRDRLGVKPLLYATTPDGGLVFASTARALRLAGLGAAVDDLAMAELFEYGFVSEERSIYGGIRKLAPATIMEWSADGVTSRRYWSPPSAGTAGPVSFDEAVAETERLLLRAVELRLHADVPVGALLSGGVDSALVCWAIRKLGGDVTAYTIGTPGHADDETSAAMLTAAEIGVPHEVKPMSASDDDVLAELVAAYGEPFACASALGMLRVSRAVRQSATVLLTGDGGDDVFLGYPRHRMMLRMERAARLVPQPLASLWYHVRPGGARTGAIKRARHAADYVTGGLGAFLSATPGLPELRRRGILGERLLDTELEARRIRWSVDAGRRLLADYLAYDLDHQFVSEYLVKVDGATMHWALEARSPFLDQDVWDFASSLPYDVRLHGGELKAVLRELVRRRISPRAAAEKKRGFTVPVESWMRGRWGAAMEEAMSDSLLHAGGWIAAPAALAALRDPALTDDVARQLWYILVAERWLRAERDTERAGA